MVRTYHRTFSNARNGKNYKSYRSYDPKNLTQALEDIRAQKINVLEASERYAIPQNTLYRHLSRKKRPTHQTAGHPNLFSAEVEEAFIAHMNVVAEWGYPFTDIDLRYLAKYYLDEMKIEKPQLKDNLPGKDWALNFIRRHKHRISKRLAANIAGTRAKVTSRVIEEFFENLADDVKDIDPQCFINYDETCMVDDPGAKKIICKRGSKYPERIITNSKTAISVMYAGAADGTILPPYVVYKSAQLWTSWTEGGPEGTG